MTFGAYSKVIILSLLVWASSDTAHAGHHAWQEKLTQLKFQRDKIFEQLEEIHTHLVWRVQQEAPALLARLSLDPPKPRATGYGLLPVIRDNAPLVRVAPKQTSYSMEWLEGRLREALDSAHELAYQLPHTTDLEPISARFEQSIIGLRSLENQLTYHEFWQESVVTYAKYFDGNNKRVALAREMNELILNNQSPQRIANLRQRVLLNAAPFIPSEGLTVQTLEGSEKVLPVTVCTDIEDAGFLANFQTGVHEAFSQSLAARSHQFSVNLKWRRIGPDTLYPSGPPKLGAVIDVNTHLALFHDCHFVLTTGASSTHALVGDRIILGTDPISRRELAHEFAHLLGFSDAYLRGYEGKPGDPYGVVLIEWTGLSDDLMGSPGEGRVSSAMIETILTAY